jgi:S-adenosylmethionine uptake transporter
MATFFLEEKITWQRWSITFLGFFGIIITLQPHSSDFDPQVLVFVIAAMSFACLDIINKKFVVKESMLSMLFYSSIFTAAFSAPSTFQYWTTPSLHDILLLFVMGALSANLILFFILKAFSLVDATAVAPYRYLELLISSIISYFVFGNLPPESTWYGAAVLIPSTMFIIYSENKKALPT